MLSLYFACDVCGRSRYLIPSGALCPLEMVLSCYMSQGVKKRAAMAGNQTPVNYLEGSYAYHYTTIA